MKTLFTYGLCLIVLLVPVSGMAAQYRDIQPGETWYLDELFDNELVLVRGKRNGMIKVQFNSGGIDWVRPSQLLTNSQSRADDAGEGIVATGIAIILLACLANPEACES